MESTQAIMTVRDKSREGCFPKKLCYTWLNSIINQVAPVSVMVSRSGRYVITFDEWHHVGEKPVVIYGEGGRLIAELTLADMKLDNHPDIEKSVSSYWWNRYAIKIFGPPAPPGKETWPRLLEDSLFIRLYWGEVIAIDLASGKVRDKAWWKTRPAGESRALRRATDDYLKATWLRLARQYFRPANFEPDPTGEGIQGILLSGQLRLKEALPLLRKIAATQRFQHWSAPEWKMGASSKFGRLVEEMTGRWRNSGNVRNLAERVIAELE